MTRLTRRLAISGLGLIVAAALAACGPGTAGASGPVNAGSGPAVGAQSDPSGPSGTLSAAALIHPAGKFFGIEAPGSPDSLTPAIEAAASVGRNPNLLGQYIAWNSPFDSGGAAKALGYGALYYMAWEPFGVTAASIAAGGQDAYISNFAKAVHAFGDPVAMSFGHEMNGNWYPWGTGQTTPADFVAAWRHIHNLFAAAGASNVIWVWNPNIINPMPAVELEPYWPGSAYVDWVGLTGYFPTTGPDTFDGIYGPTLTEVKRFTSKPVIIAETAVETGPDEVASIRNLIGGVKANHNVLGFVWFDYDKAGVDWTISGRPIARATVASSIAGMRLVGLGQGQRQGG